MTHALLRAARAAALPLLDFALPPRCPGCGVIVAQSRSFCAECWTRIEFLGDPACARCGLPFDREMGETAECAACLAEPPPWDRARAVMAYGEIARTLVMRLKYGRRTGLARLMGEQMARRLPADDRDRMLIVPVPLHRWRIWSRGFNQAALLARRVGEATGVPVEIDLLRRIKRTPPLREMGRVARARAVRGAFAVAPGHAPVKGRHVVLVDDVHTSGATAAACARVLRRAGAADVTLLCFARVTEARDEALTSATAATIWQQ